MPKPIFNAVNCLIEYQKFQLDGLIFHKITSHIDNQIQLFKLYQTFDIFLPEEIIASVFKRQHEFFIGRLAMQYALHALNYSQPFILKKGQGGEPLWPEHYLGSLSHCMHSAQSGVALLYLQHSTSHIGIDIELKRNHNFFSASATMLRQFLSASEIKILSSIVLYHDYLYLIIFSAKESIIKAIYSKFKILLEFRSIHLISLNIAERTLYFYLQKMRLQANVTAHYWCFAEEIMSYCLL